MYTQRTALDLIADPGRFFVCSGLVERRRDTFIAAARALHAAAVAIHAIATLHDIAPVSRPEIADAGEIPAVAKISVGIIDHLVRHWS